MTIEDQPDGAAASPPPLDDPAETTLPGFRESLPASLRDAGELAGIETLEDLAKATIDARRSYAGVKHLAHKRIGDYRTEDAQALMDLLGRPESPDAYGFARPADLPYGLEWNEGLAGQFAEAAHALGLPVPVAEQLVESVTEHAIRAHAQTVHEQARQAEEAERGLRAEWGADYDRHLGEARRAVIGFGGEDLAVALEDSGLGNHPAVIRAFAAVARAVAEDTPVDGRAEPEPIGEEARKRIDTPYRDPDFMAAYRDRVHPDHDAAVERIGRLFQAAVRG